MSKKLFVGRLAYETTNEQLQELFAQVGTVVSAQVIIDKFTGQGKGFGFVEMATEEEAKAAMDKLNNYSLNGRTIVVSEARPMEDRGPRTGGGGRGGFGGGGGGGRGGGYGGGGRGGGGDRSKRW